MGPLETSCLLSFRGSAYCDTSADGFGTFPDLRRRISPQSTKVEGQNVLRLHRGGVRQTTRYLRLSRTSKRAVANVLFPNRVVAAPSPFFVRPSKDLCRGGLELAVRVPRPAPQDLGGVMRVTRNDRRSAASRRRPIKCPLVATQNADGGEAQKEGPVGSCLRRATEHSRVTPALLARE